MINGVWNLVIDGKGLAGGSEANEWALFLFGRWGKILDSGEGGYAQFHAEIPITNPLVYSYQFQLSFRKDGFGWTGGCKFPAAGKCPTCPPPVWEVIPHEGSLEKGFTITGGKLEWLTVGPCDWCNPLEVPNMDVWVRWEGEYVEIMYKDELLIPDLIEETIAGPIYRLELPFTWLLDVANFSVWTDYSNGIRFREQWGIDSINKYTICSSAPWWDDVLTNGTFIYQLGMQPSDIAKFLFLDNKDLGFFTSYEEALDWAYQAQAAFTVPEDGKTQLTSSIGLQIPNWHLP